jgi:hypothetical protein
MMVELARGSDPIAVRRWVLMGMAFVAMAAAVPMPGRKPTRAGLVLRVDPNTAPAAVLETLPRIGPAMARRIIAARPFTSLDDLDRRVYGIGPVTRAALAPYLRFD